MIGVFSRSTVTPERRMEIGKLYEEALPAYRNEPGVIDYRFGADPSDETKFYIFELYKSPEALVAHRENPAFIKLMSAVASKGFPEVEITYMEINSIGPKPPGGVAAYNMASKKS